jgi:hypothetical protein
VNVGRLLRALEQRVGRPALPEIGERVAVLLVLSEAFPRLLARSLGFSLGCKRARATKHA